MPSPRGIDAHIQIEGLAELQAAIKRQQGKLPAAIGEAHKEVGRFVIGKVPAGDSHAVGAGSGATIRPSATKRDVIIKVGHGARTAAYQQWGKRVINPPAPGPGSRPHIVGAIEQNQEAIEQKFMDEIIKALEPAFYSAE